jgi:hypothetical protein
VPVYDVVNEDSALWLVMRLIEGQSLEQRLETGVLSVTQAQRVAKGLLLALRAAHAAGIVHRDLKPGNVLLEQGGEVWLTDFGIAVHRGDTALTATGLLVGSPEYVAPERVDGGDAGPASDMFSLGVVLYRALEGSSPFRRDTASATLIAVLMHEPGPARRAGELTGLVIALLRKDPAQRPTAEAALALLATAASPAAAASSAFTAPGGGQHSPTLPIVSARQGGPTLSPADLLSHPGSSSGRAAPPADFRPPRPVKRRRLSKIGVIVGSTSLLVGVTVALAVSRLNPATAANAGRVPAGKANAAKASAGPVNLALHKPVAVSSDFGADGWSAVQATDGNITPSDGAKDNGWASQGHASSGGTEWIEVNLGAEEPIDEVKLYPRNDSVDHGACFPSDFTIAVSANGKAWTVTAARSGYHSSGTAPQVFTFTRSTARYVKVTATMLNPDNAGNFYFELKQLEIFNL